MSAIAAVLFRSGLPDTEPVTRMLRAAPHRGAIVETFLHGICALGLSNTSDRPESWRAHDGSWAAVLTGTVDNLAEIIADLASRGITSADASPAGVVLAGFRILGASLPDRCRGTFAAAITDGAHLWCWRDHLGMRTLFYRDEPGACYIATEAKQVAAGAGIPREPDVEVLTRIFYGAYDDDTPTALKGIRRLPKAMVLNADREGLRLTRYWHPERLLETSRLSPVDLRDRFDEVMGQAVGRAMTGHDVISLSGGIDSPTIAAFANGVHQKQSDRPIAALAAVYPELPSVDETRYIEAVARHLSIPLHTYQKRARPLDRLAEWVQLLDGPVPKILMTDAEEHLGVARRLGYRTMLTGEVAEFVVDMRGGLSAHLFIQGRLRALWRRMRTQRARGASLRGVCWQALYGLVPGALEAAFTRSRGFYGWPDLPRWIDPRKINEAAARYLVPPRHRWKQQQCAGFVGPGLTMEANEVVQAVCGVRVRMPWADVDVWEFFLSLPAEQKFPDAVRKGLIRRMMRGRVPDVVLDRTDKTVFRDSMLARADYPAFRRWLIEFPFRIDGVNYAHLAERLDREDFTISEFVWAKDLAAVHAFAAPVS